MNTYIVAPNWCTKQNKKKYPAFAFAYVHAESLIY